MHLKKFKTIALSCALAISLLCPCAVMAQEAQPSAAEQPAEEQPVEETFPVQEEAAGEGEEPGQESAPEGSEAVPEEKSEEVKEGAAAEEEAKAKEPESAEETKKAQKKTKAQQNEAEEGKAAESGADYLSQTVTPVDECKSGIVEVAVGYEFDDGSFDPWIAGTGFLVSQDRALTLTEFTSITADSETYQEIAEARRGGYLALGIDILDFASIEPHLALCVYAADGSRIRASAQDLDGTVSFIELSKQLIGVRPFILATDGTFEKGLQSGYALGYKKTLLDNTLPSTIKNVFVEEAAIRTIGDGAISFLSTADNGIAGGPVIGEDMIVYGICLENSAGSGKAADIRAYYSALTKEDYGISFDASEKQRASIFDPPYCYIIFGVLGTAIIVCFVVGILLIKSSNGEKPAREKKPKKERERKPFSRKKKEEMQEEQAEKEKVPARHDYVPEETEKYDAEYLESARQRQKEERARKARQAKEEEEARKRRSREILEGDDDDDDGESDTGILVKKRYPYFERKSTGERIDISKTKYILGKSQKEADYRIAGNNTISRTHCEIITKEGRDGTKRRYIKDLGSANETFVNGALVKGDVEKYLSDGDIVRLSDEEFVFHDVET